MSFKIGDKVWLFDGNRRVYSKSNGYFGSGPIYSEHFYQDIIDGETSRSWIIGKNKYSKNNPIGIYTDVQKKEKIWDHDHRQEIIRKVESCSFEKLKQISFILEV